LARRSRAPVIWVPPLPDRPRNTSAVIKRPEPGDWQRAADEMQAIWIRTYRHAQDYVSASIAVRLAAEYGEHGASERPSDNEYRMGVLGCVQSLTAAMMIPTREPADRPTFDFPVDRFDPWGLFTVKDRRRAR
jgi:hypothetical protein